MASSDSGPDDPPYDHEFTSMVRRVRRTADEELAEIEHETERAQLKRQDLTARSMEAMMEGERWQVSLGSRLVEGRVVHVGQNFTGFEDRHGNLHDVVHRAMALIRIVEIDSREGRAPTTLRPATFMARLLGLEQVREVELAGSDGTWALIGTIDSVNSDHLILTERSGQASIVVIDAIGYLGRAFEQGRRKRDRPIG